MFIKEVNWKHRGLAHVIRYLYVLSTKQQSVCGNWGWGLPPSPLPHIHFNHFINISRRLWYLLPRKCRSHFTSPSTMKQQGREAVHKLSGELATFTLRILNHTPLKLLLAWQQKTHRYQFFPYCGAIFEVDIMPFHCSKHVPSIKTHR